MFQWIRVQGKVIVIRSIKAPRIDSFFWRFNKEWEIVYFPAWKFIRENNLPFVVGLSMSQVCKISGCFIKSLNLVVINIHNSNDVNSTDECSNVLKFLLTKILMLILMMAWIKIHWKLSNFFSNLGLICMYVNNTYLEDCPNNIFSSCSIFNCSREFIPEGTVRL